MLGNHWRSSSILAVGSLPNVRSSSLLSLLIRCVGYRSSETAVETPHTLSDLDPIKSKRSNFEHVGRLNSSRFLEENFNGPQRSNLGEVSHPNFSGFSGENTSFDRREEIRGLNLIGYGQQRSNFGGVNQRNHSGFNAESPQGQQRNNNGFNVESSNDHERSNLGGVQQLNSQNNFRGYRNQTSEGNMMISGIQANGYYHDQSASHNENDRNSGEFYNNANVVYNRLDTGKSYQPESGIYGGSTNEFNRDNFYQKNADVLHRSSSHEFRRESLKNPGEFERDSHGEPRELQQNTNEHFETNKFYWSNNENPMHVSHQREYPLVDCDRVTDGLVTHKLPESGRTVPYKGTLAELDEYCKDGKVKEAVEVLALLGKNGVPVDLRRYLALLKVCGETRSLEEAKAVHNHIVQAMAGEVGVVVNNKILDMYSRCGSMADAYQLFEKMQQRNLTSWDTMISGFANNNLGEEAIDLFIQFKEMGLQPDGGLFNAVFNACGVLGAVNEGMLHFESMEVDFGIAPTMEHYVSIIEMLGKSGYLDEALEFIEKMPVEPSVDVWETLMTLCRVNGYMDLGNRCAEIVDQLDSSRLTEVTRMGLLPLKASDKEKERKDSANRLDFKRRTHHLRAGDRSHPENDRIYEQLHALVSNMREVGYTPDTRFALHDVDPEARAEALLAHSEKLAAAYILLTSPPRSDIRIMKNLRFCRDCHEAMKIISKITGRLIISRDAKRFHHFKDGVCSCKDYY